MKILGIETSCDETAVALVEARRDRFIVHNNIVSSQITTHAQYGGVVPEVAARMHLEVLQPLIEQHIGRKKFSDIDLIAVTRGPGLITSLMVGVQSAKTLSYSFGIPLVGINHLEGHLYAAWLTDDELYQHPKLYFPSIVLIVSGGHTELLVMHDHGKYTLLGQTLDDAAGEAFDKVAKILELGYPGGPVISKIATSGNAFAIKFPRPMINSDDYNVSFSGLKTSVLYYLQRQKKIQKTQIPDIAASFQQAVVDLLIAKTSRACEEHHPKSLILAGGVSANALLRSSFESLASQRDIKVLLPSLEYTGDNAAMIAAAGYFRRRKASKKAWKSLTFDPHAKFVT